MATARSFITPAFCLLAVASLIYGLVAKFALGHDWLWDLRVYQGAVDSHLLDMPVYGTKFGSFQFVYPPLVLEAFALLGQHLSVVFLSGYALILGCVLWVAPTSLRWSLLLYFGVLAFVSEPLLLALRTGNLSVFATLLLLLLWRLSDRIGTAPLLAAIIVSALIKPQYAAFLALVPLTGRVDPATWLRAGFGLVVIVAIWVAQLIWMPEAFHGFLASLNTQLGFDGSGLDLGRAVFAQVHAATRNVTLAMMAHVAFVAVLGVVWLFFLYRLRGWNGDRKTRQALIFNGAFLMCILASPRVKIYDTAVMGLLCIEAGVLWGQSRRNRSTWTTPLIGLGVVMGVYAFACTQLQFAVFYRDTQPLALSLFFGVAVYAITRVQTPGDRMVNTRI